MRLFEIKMPETGDVGEIVVTDVLIQANQHIAFDQPMITVETDMATMEIPSPRSGVVHEIKSSAGAKLRAGSRIKRTVRAKR